MDPPVSGSANQQTSDNFASSLFKLVWEQQDFLLLQGKLILSSLGCIYVGAHAALRRPPSAAPAKSKNGEKVDKEDDQFTQGLLPSDAILFPLMAATALISLYYLIQWLNDPQILTKILRVYMSTMSVASLTTLLAHTIRFTATFVFPNYWVSRGHQPGESVIYHVDPIKERHQVWTHDKGFLATIEPRTSPLPGNLAWLGWAKNSPRLSHFLWELRHLLTESWTVRLKIHGILREKFEMTLDFVVGGVLALSAIGAYFVTESTMLSNLMGYGFCYSTFLIMSPTTFLTGSLLLSGLFFYDIVMVFFTPYMVTVATKLDVPIKLTFQSASKSSILGLGDIVVPGIVICLALRFDLWRHYQRQIQYVPIELKSETKTTSGEVVANSQLQRKTKKAEYVDVVGTWGDTFWTSTWLGLFSRPDDSKPFSVKASAFPKTYFYTSLIGYAIGMLVTLAMLFVFKHGQPALLYLVPGVLGSLWLTALVRGELKEMWEYTEDGSLDTCDVVVELDGDGNVIKEIKADKKTDDKTTVADEENTTKKESNETVVAVAQEPKHNDDPSKSNTDKELSEEELKTAAKAEEDLKFAKANKSYDVFRFSITAPARHGYVEKDDRRNKEHKD